MYSTVRFLYYNFLHTHLETTVHADTLKGTWQWTGLLKFLHKSVRHRSLAQAIESFRFWVRIRGDIRIENRLPAFNDTVSRPSKVNHRQFIVKSWTKDNIVLQVCRGGDGGGGVQWGQGGSGRPRARLSGTKYVHNIEQKNLITVVHLRWLYEIFSYFLKVD